jgi:hypothetical protein
MSLAYRKNMLDSRWAGGEWIETSGVGYRVFESDGRVPEYLYWQ